MSLRLMMDEHVDFEITARLRAAGVDALTVQELGLAGRSDIDLLARSMELGREIVTQDQDFLVEGTRRQRAAIPFCAIFHVPQNQRLLRVYTEWLEMYAKLENPEDVAGRVIFIP